MTQTTEEMRAAMMNQVGTNPRKTAGKLFSSLAVMAIITRPLPEEERVEAMTTLIEEVLIAFKTNIQAETIAAQTTAADALASTLAKGN